MEAYYLLQRKREKVNNGLGLKISENKPQNIEFVNSAKGSFPSSCKIRTLPRW